MSARPGRLALGLLTAGLLAAGCGSESSRTTGPTAERPRDFDFGANHARRAVAFGDGLTAGGGESRAVGPLGAGTAGGYPALLEARLRGLDPAWRVLNRGAAGETTTAGVRRLPAVLASDRPGFVLLMEGAHDATREVDPAFIVANLEAMVQVVQGGQSIPLLATIPASPRHHPTAASIVEEANGLIRTMGAARRVVVAEVGDGLREAELWGTAPGRDPPALTDQGYQRLADIWYQAMQRAIPAQAGEGVAATPRRPRRR